MEYRIVNGILLVEPGEEIDHHQAENIIRYTECLIRQCQVRMLIFDLGKTIFMDSAGVGMLIGLYREIKSRGGSVGIIRMGKSIERIYRMAGLSKIIPHYEDEALIMELCADGRDDNER